MILPQRQFVDLLLDGVFSTLSRVKRSFISHFSERVAIAVDLLVCFPMWDAKGVILNVNDVDAEPRGPSRPEGY